MYSLQSCLSDALHVLLTYTSSLKSIQISAQDSVISCATSSYKRHPSHIFAVYPVQVCLEFCLNTKH